MRKLAIAVALASTALATPALARDKAWYVGVEGGAMIVEDIHFDIGATPDAMKIDHNYGYDVGGMVGYDFGMFRVETEVSYKSANVDAISSSLRIPAYNSAGALVQSLKRRGQRLQAITQSAQLAECRLAPRLDRLLTGAEVGAADPCQGWAHHQDRKSTRLNSSHRT